MTAGTGRLTVGWSVQGLILLAIVAGPCSEAVALEPTPGYTMVQRAFLREDFTLVTSLAHGFLQQYPDAPEVHRVWLWLVLSLDRLQRSSEALREIDRLKAHLPDDDPFWPEVVFWEGEISRLSLQLSRATSAYQRLLEQYPASPWASQALLDLGLIALHQEAYETAMQYFHEVALQQAENPVASDALVYEGLCDLRLARFKEAVAVFEALLTQLKDPGAFGQVAFYLGEGYSGLGRYDDAALAYQRAIAFASESAALSRPGRSLDHSGTGQAGIAQWATLAQFGLGWAYYEIGRCEESLQPFEQYLSQAAEGGHRTEALFARGSCFMKLRNEPAALQCFEDILARDPDHALAFESGLILADLHRKDGRLDVARTLLHTLLRRYADPLSRAQLQLLLGAVVLEQGNAAQAKTVFELAAQSDQPSIRQAALNGLGDVQMFLGHLTAAERCYEEAMHIAPDTPRAAYAAHQVGRVRLQLGSLDEAVRIFQGLIANADPALADEARLALAIAYLNQHEAELARSLLEAIRQRDPTSPAAGRAAYYEALLALGDDDETLAQARCQEAIDQAPQSDEAFEARLLLADLQDRGRPAHEVMASLEQVYAAGQLSRSQRATLAKRVGDLARSEQEYSRAIAWYLEAEELLPSLAGEVSYRIASCDEEAGDLEEAVSWYARIDEPPWRVRGQLAAAKVLERLDRVAEAEAIYERLAGEPIPEAKLVQERLAVLRAGTVN